MHMYLSVYIIAGIVTSSAFIAFIYFKKQWLSQFRRDIRPGQEVIVEYKGELQPAEIQNIHNGLVFCWLNYYGCFTYVEFNKIFPDDYK